MIICARNGCEVAFDAKTHNQKFCGPECCRIATNERIMEKYYAKRDQRAGKIRYCGRCKETRLSRYNDSLICGSCSEATISAANKAASDMLKAINWQSA